MGLEASVVIDVRRVAWRFWTWHLEAEGHVVIGAGNRLAAAAAVDQFLLRHGGKPNNGGSE